jgi:hypothetical protein
MLSPSTGQPHIKEPFYLASMSFHDARIAGGVRTPPMWLAITAYVLYDTRFGRLIPSIPTYFIYKVTVSVSIPLRL